MKKSVYVLAILLAQVIASKSFAVEKSFSCNSGDLNVKIETEPVDPEDAAGTLDDERADQAYNLFQSDEFAAPKGTTLYQIDGKGDGDTDFYFVAIPDSLETARKNSKLVIQLIEKSDRAATSANPMGIIRNNVTCAVE